MHANKTGSQRNFASTSVKLLNRGFLSPVGHRVLHALQFDRGRYCSTVQQRNAAVVFLILITIQATEEKRMTKTKKKGRKERGRRKRRTKRMRIRTIRTITAVAYSLKPTVRAAMILRLDFLRLGV